MSSSGPEPSSSAKPSSEGLADLLKQKVELDAKIQQDFFREKTFMAIDVQKSTDIKKGKNKDDVFLTFDAYHRIVHKFTEENGGQVHETAGDGIMCVFDDANKACKAAIAIQTSLPAFNENENRLKRPVVLRIGLNSGRVLIDENRSIGELFDSTIDTAGHLQKEGRGGEVVITQATYDSIDDKGLFIRDKFWEAKQTQLYRYAVQAGMAGAEPQDSDVPEEFRGMEKFTPVLDINTGKSFRDLSLGSLIWIKLPTGLFAEGRVTMARSEDDFGVLVVALPDSTLAYARVRSSLRLCMDYERAQLAAQKTMLSPQLMRFTGEEPGETPLHVQNKSMTTYFMILGYVAAGFLLLLLVVVLLLK